MFDNIVNKTLAGSGFVINSPEEKTALKKKLEDYYLEFIFDILMHHLSDEQIAELETTPDLESEATQNKVTQMAKAVPGFDVILRAQLDREVAEIGLSGRIPEIESSNF